MVFLAQIFMVIITICMSEVNSVTIFQGLSIKKGIDISLIPFPIKPIAFIKEKWTPFGSFGIKHEIARREVVNVAEPEVVVTPVPVPLYIVSTVPRPENPPVAPVVEHPEELPHEPIEHVPSEAPLITPPAASVVENVAPVTPVPVVAEEPVASVVPEVVVPSSGVPPVLITSVPHIPVKAPPLETPVLKPLPPNLDTDISRATVVNDYLNSVEKPAVPVVPAVNEVKEPDIPSIFGGIFPRGSLRTGSKLAIQLGSAFLHYMNQLFNSPRSPLARFAES